jgi:hypothetical protein
LEETDGQGVPSALVAGATDCREPLLDALSEKKLFSFLKARNNDLPQAP